MNFEIYCLMSGARLSEEARALLMSLACQMIIGREARRKEFLTSGAEVRVTTKEAQASVGFITGQVFDATVEVEGAREPAAIRFVIRNVDAMRILEKQARGELFSVPLPRSLEDLLPPTQSWGHPN